MVTFDRAEVVIEVSEWVEVPVKNLTIENVTSTLSNASTESSPSPDSSTGNVEANLSGEGVENSTVNTIPEKVTEDTKPTTEKKLRKKTFRVPLKVSGPEIQFCC